MKNNIKSKIWRVYIPHFWICEQIWTQLEATHGNSCTSGYKYGVGLELKMSINIINFFHLKSDCSSLIVLLHMFASVKKYIFNQKLLGNTHLEDFLYIELIMSDNQNCINMLKQAFTRLPF